MKRVFAALGWVAVAFGQAHAPLPPLPAPLLCPSLWALPTSPTLRKRFCLVGIVMPLYCAGSPFLKAERVGEAEEYNMSTAVPGRISSIVNIHNPSIEIHTVEGAINTGAAVISVGRRRAQHAQRRVWRRRTSCRSSTTTASTR